MFCCKAGAEMRMFKLYLFFLSCLMWAKCHCSSFQLTIRRKTKFLVVCPARIIVQPEKRDKLQGIHAGPLRVKKHVQHFQLIEDITNVCSLASSKHHQSKKIQLTLPGNRQVQTVFVTVYPFKHDRAAPKTVSVI